VVRKKKYVAPALRRREKLARVTEQQSPVTGLPAD